MSVQRDISIVATKSVSQIRGCVTERMTAGMDQTKPTVTRGAGLASSSAELSTPVYPRVGCVMGHTTAGTALMNLIAGHQCHRHKIHYMMAFSLIYFLNKKSTLRVFVPINKISIHISSPNGYNGYRFKSHIEHVQSMIVKLTAAVIVQWQHRFC